jgi:hypothetical protein
MGKHANSMVNIRSKRIALPDYGIFLRFPGFREAIFGEKGKNLTFFS